MSTAPSGQQHEIRHGQQRATVVEVGGGIREYAVGHRAVLHPYPRDRMCDGAHGAPLVPWPNRLGDGRYSFDGTSYQVALTEPEKHNAIHGFLHWRPWELVEHHVDIAVMGATLFPLQGYPFLLQLRVEYRLTDEGLEVTTTATNLGDHPAPYGCGQHPYLSPGDGLIDDCTLRFGAGTRIVTDAERQLPTGTEPVAGTAYDFGEGRRLGDQSIDFAFTDLTRDADGRSWVRLTGADGHTAALWVDESYPLLEVFTADTLPPDRRRRGLGVEPMTCPPNAFRTGDRVIRLEPGATVTTRWGAVLEGRGAAGA
ncbi:MAG TPA: aldose 1-epimerase family protein [Nocardioides sp.]|nr:aldose 1-epimerase family protein [Nocardioides sp.]